MKRDELRLVQPSWGNWDQIYDQFRWNIPKYLNIADVACDRHASGNQVAIFCENSEGKESRYTFKQLKKLSNQLSNVLKHHGVQKGDRVGIIFATTPRNCHFTHGDLQIGCDRSTTFCFVRARSCWFIG